MEGDNVGVGFGKIRNDVVDWFYYQVNVDWCGNIVIMQ